MGTSKKRISENTKDSLTSSPGASLVSHSASPVKDSGKRMTVISGRKCLEQFMKSSPDGSWRKTFAGLLVGMKEWFSKRCSLSWKLKVTAYKRMYFQLQVSARRTEETGSGLLPTPLAMDTGATNLQKIDNRRAKIKAKGINGNGFGPSLMEMAQRGLLPTPIASDCHLREILGKKENFQITDAGVRKVTGNGSTVGVGLALLVRLLPTPVSRDWRGQHAREFYLEPEERQLAARSLPGIIETKDGKTSRKLSPLFVSEMMGFPQDWILCPFLLPSRRP